MLGKPDHEFIGVKGAFYEFQWPAVLEALGAAKSRGAAITIVFDDMDDGRQRPQQDLDGNKLRRDQIWFTGKDNAQVSHLFPLLDFSPRKGEALEKAILVAVMTGCQSLANWKAYLLVNTHKRERSETRLSRRQRRSGPMTAC